MARWAAKRGMTKRAGVSQRLPDRSSPPPWWPRSATPRSSAVVEVASWLGLTDDRLRGQRSDDEARIRPLGQVLGPADDPMRLQLSSVASGTPLSAALLAALDMRSAAAAKSALSSDQPRIAGEAEHVVDRDRPARGH